MILPPFSACGCFFFQYLSDRDTNLETGTTDHDGADFFAEGFHVLGLSSQSVEAVMAQSAEIDRRMGPTLLTCW